MSRLSHVLTKCQLVTQVRVELATLGTISWKWLLLTTLRRLESASKRLCIWAGNVPAKDYLLQYVTQLWAELTRCRTIFTFKLLKLANNRLSTVWAVTCQIAIIFCNWWSNYELTWQHWGTISQMWSSSAAFMPAGICQWRTIHISFW